MDTVKIKIPTDWNDVTLKQFEEVSKLNDIEYEDPLDKFRDMLHILVIDDEAIVNTIMTDNLEEVVEGLQFIQTSVPVNEINDITLSGLTYGWEKNYNSLTFGEIISLETLIQQRALDNHQFIGLYLAVFLRLKDKDGTLEEFNADNVFDIWEMVLETSCIEVMGIVGKFYQWRNEVLTNYKALFGGDGAKEIDPLDTTPRMNPQWSWYALVVKLGNNDITKFDEVYKQNYIGTMNLLSYWKDRDDYLERLKQHNNK